MSIEKDFPHPKYGGRISFRLGGSKWHHFDTYNWEDELPNDEGERDICLDHIENKRKGSELWNELLDEELYYRRGTTPPDNPTDLITRLSCEGAGCSPDDCGLKIEQFNLAGEKIREIRASDL